MSETTGDLFDFPSEVASPADDLPSHKRREEDPRIKGMVDHLLHLARTADTISASRAGLAELRQAIDDPLRGAKHVAPYLGSVTRADEYRFFEVASLFALHRKHQDGVSLGDALRRSKDKRGSDSIEGRFVALISTSPDHLYDRLRQAVTLLKADEIPLDWHRLLNDVLHWDRADKRFQHALARDFYRAPNDNAATEAAAE